MNRVNKKMISLSILPRAGLGNKLFSWAWGAVFSEINSCPHLVTGMTRIHLGPILRGEKSMRFYSGYFKNEVRILPLKYILYSKVLKNPNELNTTVSEKGIYVFQGVPDWNEFFNQIRPYREIVLSKFSLTLSDRINRSVDDFELPEIGVHIRMGDFRKLQDGEDFAKVGLVRTPLGYFIKTIKQIREVVGENTKVTIFSDGTDLELQKVLALENIVRAKEGPDIVHMIVLSKSKILVSSASSSFSQWATFLGNAIGIHHPDHFHVATRPEGVNKRFFEGIIPADTKIVDIPQLYGSLKRLGI